MLKHAALVAAAVAGMVAFAMPGKPLPPSGSWSVDARHSDAQLLTDGTTDYGKKKINFTVGFTRMNGTVKLDGGDSAKSAFDFRMYPAGSMAPPIDEDGKVKIEWFANHANATLLCFHSKGAQQTAEGGLKTSGSLVLTRVDRNVELTPNEGYAGPVYGPPIIHRLTREATFVFDFPAAGGGKEVAIMATGSTKVVREDFPQLLKAVMATYWPPVVQDRNCQAPTGTGEDYTGSPCTGTFMMTPPLPQAPQSVSGEDYPGSAGFNSFVGERLTIFVRMHLTPAGSAGQAGAGN